MSDDVGSGLLLVLGVIVAIGLVLTAIAFGVIWKYRLPVRGAVATLASLAYVVSPVDAVPEFPLGPVGLIDDVMVIVAAVVYVRGLVAARRGDGLTVLDDRSLDDRSGGRPPRALPRGRRASR